MSPTAPSLTVCPRHNFDRFTSCTNHDATSDPTSLAHDLAPPINSHMSRSSVGGCGARNIDENILCSSHQLIDQCPIRRRLLRKHGGLTAVEITGGLVGTVSPMIPSHRLNWQGASINDYRLLYFGAPISVVFGDVPNWPGTG